MLSRGGTWGAEPGVGACESRGRDYREEATAISQVRDSWVSVRWEVGIF